MSRRLSFQIKRILFCYVIIAILVGVLVGDLTHVVVAEELVAGPEQYGVIAFKGKHGQVYSVSIKYPGLGKRGHEIKRVKFNREKASNNGGYDFSLIPGQAGVGFEPSNVPHAVVIEVRSRGKHIKGSPLETVIVNGTPKGALWLNTRNNGKFTRAFPFYDYVPTVLALNSVHKRSLPRRLRDSDNLIAWCGALKSQETRRVKIAGRLQAKTTEVLRDHILYAFDVNNQNNLRARSSSAYYSMLITPRGFKNNGKVFDVEHFCDPNFLSVDSALLSQSQKVGQKRKSRRDRSRAQTKSARNPSAIIGFVGVLPRNCPTNGFKGKGGRTRGQTPECLGEIAFLRARSLKDLIRGKAKISPLIGSIMKMTPSQFMVGGDNSYGVGQPAAFFDRGQITLAYTETQREKPGVSFLRTSLQPLLSELNSLGKKAKKKLKRDNLRFESLSRVGKNLYAWKEISPTFDSNRKVLRFDNEATLRNVYSVEIGKLDMALENVTDIKMSDLLHNMFFVFGNSSDGMLEAFPFYQNVDKTSLLRGGYVGAIDNLPGKDGPALLRIADGKITDASFVQGANLGDGVLTVNLIVYNAFDPSDLQSLMGRSFFNPYNWDLTKAKVLLKFIFKNYIIQPIPNRPGRYLRPSPNWRGSGYEDSIAADLFGADDDNNSGSPSSGGSSGNSSNGGSASGSGGNAGGGSSTPTPTRTPNVTPTSIPSQFPTQTPTTAPTTQPSATPTRIPSATPTRTPSATPTRTPSATPTRTPSSTPTSTPSPLPTQTPAFTPTVAVTVTHPPLSTPTPPTTVPGFL
ncbi:MAG TPA: hypothetical protein PKD37_01655 [Oligoflexia bacterium]|nr:hypothetical protein [Oligoflexia bacterium]HMP26682.1 hypothetical protein [Oligoflexia bacterium]